MSDPIQAPAIRDAVADFRVAAERLRLTVFEDVPASAPSPVHELGDLITELEALAIEHNEAGQLRRRAHQLLLQAQSWPLVINLNATSRERGGDWPAWMEAVWRGLQELGAITSRIDRESTPEQSKE
jgi:hypothetical protein